MRLFRPSERKPPARVGAVGDAACPRWAALPAARPLAHPGGGDAIWRVGDRERPRRPRPLRAAPAPRRVSEAGV